MEPMSQIAGLATCEIEVHMMQACSIEALCILAFFETGFSRRLHLVSLQIGEKRPLVSNVFLNGFSHNPPNRDFFPFRKVFQCLVYFRREADGRARHSIVARFAFCFFPAHHLFALH
jgi:hypothetical protein